MAASLPITSATWTALVTANRTASPWAERGIFATAIGPSFDKNPRASFLYVGKSAGPLGTSVGSEYDQATSGRASLDWMLGRRNPSAFWQLVDAIAVPREEMAWTNVCKMDVKGGGKPPRGASWETIANVSRTALAEELTFLKPRVALFVTGDDYRSDVHAVLSACSYKPLPHAAADIAVFEGIDGRRAAICRHPQGWSRDGRAVAVNFVRGSLNA